MICGHYILLFSVMTFVSGIERQSRDESKLSVGQMFASLLDSILGDNKNVSIDATALPTWWTKLTSNTGPGTQNTPTPSSNTTDNPVLNVNTTNTRNVSLGSDFISLTTTTESYFDDRCSAEYTFKELCDSGVVELLQDLNIWDVYGQIFSNDVIEALLLNCESGHWCLYDEFDYWNGLMVERAEMAKNSAIFTQICNSGSLSCFDKFLQNVTDCPIQERMNFTVEAVKLICEMRKDTSLEIICMSHLLAAFHVTVVEFLRDDSNKVLRNESINGLCTSPAILMSKSVLCVEEKCPNHQGNFRRFSPWKWFTPNIDNYKTQCSFPADTCDEDAQFGPQTSTATYTHITEGSASSTGPTTLANSLANEASQNGDNNEVSNLSFAAKLTMVLGVFAGGVIAVSGFFVLIYACWRKHGSLRRVDKVGYQPLRNHD